MSINETLDYWLVPIVLSGGFLGIALWLAVMSINGGVKLWRLLYEIIHAR